MDFHRGDFGKWIALISITIRLFCPKHFPGKSITHTFIISLNFILILSALLNQFKHVDWLEIPAALILLLVVAPSLIAGTVRESWVGAVICLIIACYLFHEHIKASDGFRNALTQKHGLSNTIGIVALLVYPVWTIFFNIF